jgi:ubiquitin C-terminal hydrolase
VEILGEIIPVEFSGYTLESCIAQFFNTEEIERKCEHCGSQRSAQATSFVKDPETLIIQLNRFRFSQEDSRVVKIHEPLIFPTDIQLPSRSSYRIIATVNHNGELADSGHYTCLLMDKTTGTYTLIDDSSVIPSVTINEELSQQVYLLIYAK